MREAENKNFKEEDLYDPVSKLFLKQGFSVRSEVKACDVVAVRDGVTVVVELKKTFQLKLVYQALERQKLADYVFVAIPRPVSGQKTKNWWNMLALLKRLDIGLILVALDSEISGAQVVTVPETAMKIRNGKKQKNFQTEFISRSDEYNKGGVTKKKIATAYREKSIELACVLERFGEMSLSDLRILGFDEKSLQILAKNFYHWFVRIDKGVYGLSDKGREELEKGQFRSIVDFYRAKVEKIER